MEIKNRKVLILGGWGLVGMAVCRKLIEEGPKELIILSLEKTQAEEAISLLSKLTDIKLTPEWGNIFSSVPLKDLSREEILENEENRNLLITDVLNDLTEEILDRAFLYQVISKHQPEIVIDCINSATGLAYQDIFRGGIEVRKGLKQLKESGTIDTLPDEVEKLLGTMYIPQLIRHIQILYESMKRVKTESFIKIGTSGTGGMGLNIPYTHSEEKLSRMLLSKSAVAGAQSMLLWLMARTPDAPITKEIKPAAAIAWKKIEYGEIKRRGKPVQLYDCLPDHGFHLNGTICLKMDKGPWRSLDKNLKSVYIDTGENGIFSLEEFTAITSRGQMEFVTPEEIANNVVYEIKGGNTGHDIINAMDNATMGPTYRAGSLRVNAIRKMRRLLEDRKGHSVAFELLGPPKLSKLLYEAFLLKEAFGSMKEIMQRTPAELTEKVDEIVRKDKSLRAEIISIGIPILMKDGKTLLRGPEIKIPPYRGHNQIDISDPDIEKWTTEGWLDLREKNFKFWLERFHKIREEMESIPLDDTSSQFDRTREYWDEHKPLEPGKVIGWLFLSEEHGLRMKE